MSLAPLGGIPASTTTGTTGGAGTQAGDGGFAAAIDALLAALLPQGTTPDTPTTGIQTTDLPAQPTDLPAQPTVGATDADTDADTDVSPDASLLAGLVAAGFMTPDLAKATPTAPATGAATPNLSDLAVGGLGGVTTAAGTSAVQRLAAEPMPATAVPASTTPTPATVADVPQTASDPGAIAPAPGSDALLATAGLRPAATGTPAAKAAGEPTTPTTDEPVTGSTIPRVDASPVPGPSVQDGPGGDGLPDRGAQARAGMAASPASGVTSSSEPSYAEDPATTTTPIVTTTTPIVTATTQAAPLVAAAPAAATPAATPVEQVATETVRMFQAGNGLHRMTITLNPESLGQVRVSLSVKDGQVSVRLAASESARHTLVEGAPELRRLLEAVGATEVRVVVRDLSGAESSRSTAWSFGQDSSAPGQHGQGRSSGQDGLTGQPAGDGAGTQSDRHAGTRAGSTARDGSTDGSSPLRPDPAVTPRTHSTGVDVTV